MYYHVPHSSGPSLTARESSSAATCPAALDLVSLLGEAPTLPRASRFWTPPPCSGRLQRCHVPRGFGPCLPALEGLGATTCPAALDPASLLGMALALPHASQLRSLPPCSGGL
jgi:hypothetical protein